MRRHLLEISFFLARPVFLAARWHHLVLVNYAIDPDLLTPFLPAGVELDRHDGQCFASLVAFCFEKTSAFGWIPALGHRDFEEVNLRFYVVRHEPSGEIRRGVVFINEIVPKPLLAWTARTFYSEPYVYMPTGQHAFAA